MHAQGVLLVAALSVSLQLLAATLMAVCILRVYCVLLRPDIEALLGGPHKVAPSEAFFRLLVAVHQLDNLAIQWCGGKIGQLLLHHIASPACLPTNEITPTDKMYASFPEWLRKCLLIQKLYG